MLASAGGIDVTLRLHCRSANRTERPASVCAVAAHRPDGDAGVLAASDRAAISGHKFRQLVRMPVDAYPALVLRFAVADAASA